MEVARLKFLDGVYSLEELDRPGNAQLRANCMRKNHEAGEPVICLCRDPGAKLSVVLKERYFLRRYQGTVNQHAPDCAWSVEPRMRNTDSRHRPGVQRDSDGDVKVYLDSSVFPVRKAEREERAGAAPVAVDDDRPPGKATTSQGTLRLQGLIQYLVDEADLGSWHAGFEGKRGVLPVMRWLSEVVANTAWTKKRGLAEVVRIPTKLYSDDSLRADITNSPVHGQTSKSGELVVVGFLRQAAPMRNNAQYMTVTLEMFTTYFVCVAADLEKWKTHNRMGLVLEESGQAVPHVLVAMTVRLSPNRPEDKRQQPVVITNMSALKLTKQFIPVMSSHEERMADHLVANRRKFFKPIRYKREEESMFPDFELLDVEPAANIEVWGMGDDEYLTRKKAKTTECRKTGVPLIEWDAFNNAPLPALPQANAARYATDR